MSGKREASYTIDPNTLEQKEKDEDSESQIQTNTRKIPKEQRKIFKIKRPGDVATSEKSETKVAFKLSQSQEIKPAGEDANGTQNKDASKQKEVANPFANLLFKADRNIFNGIGIFSNTNSINLFTSNKDTEQSAQANANPTSSASIFASNGTAAGKNIFNNGAASLKGTSSSLFKNTAPVQTTININNDDDGSGDSAQLEEVQKIESDPAKSTATFAYDESCPVLLTLKAAKFKKAGSDLIENLELVLQKQKQTNIKYISVRLPLTKKSIFSGILVEKRSEARTFGGKKQNVEVTAFFKEKQKFSKVLLKFQFEDEEAGEKLLERIQQMLTDKEEAAKPDEAKEKKE